MSTVKALSDCWVGTKSGPFRLEAGTEFESDDALVKGHPALFTEPPAEPKRPSLQGIRGKQGSDA